MNRNNLPTGWDEDKVRRVLSHYDEQTEDQALAEDEADVDSAEAVMTVPRDLVPQVRKLIAKRNK